MKGKESSLMGRKKGREDTRREGEGRTKEKGSG